MAMRLFITDTWKQMPPPAEHRLLDLYEQDVRQQSSGCGLSRFDWNQELITIALQRYVLYTDENQTDLASNELKKAAALRGNKNPSQADLEFERQLAKRLFGSRGGAVRDQ
jgi:hypothetical protein